MGDKRKRYTKEFKLEAVRMLEAGDRTGQQIEHDLGIGSGQVYKWRKELGSLGRASLSGQRDCARRGVGPTSKGSGLVTRGPRDPAKSSGHVLKTPEMKYRFMAAHRGEHRVEKMAENLGVTRSGFYAWLRRGRAARQAADEHLRELIEGIQQEVHYRYGSPRMTRELRRRGRRVGHNRVARLMRQGKLGARRRKAYRVTTKSAHAHPVAENLLQRLFRVSAANRVWASDITYIPTAEGWMYLCVVLDLYSRRVVGWSMGQSLGVELAVRALLMAVDGSPTPSGVCCCTPTAGCSTVRGRFVVTCGVMEYGRA